MYDLSPEERVTKLLKTIRKLEISLFFAHCEAAKTDPVYYAGLTLSSTELVSSIARISPAIESRLHLMPANLSSIFRRNFSVDDLLNSMRPPSELRLHEGVPELILFLQNTQQRLLFLHREMALISPPVACVLLDLERKEINRLAHIEQSDIALIDTIKALWVLPFKNPSHVKRFEKSASVALASQFVLDM